MFCDLILLCFDEEVKLMSIFGSWLGKVEGVEVGLTLGLEILDGTLKLSLVDCGCLVKDINITLDGGASWLYQGYAKLSFVYL